MDAVEKDAGFVREAEFAASLDEMAGVSAFVEGALEEGGCPPAISAKMMIVCDEIASNIVRYSGSAKLRVRVEGASDAWKLGFADAGTPWNPLEHDDPDTTQSVEERPVGGLGILLVKKLMDDVQYARVDGWNVFTVRKSV